MNLKKSKKLQNLSGRLPHQFFNRIVNKSFVHLSVEEETRPTTSSSPSYFPPRWSFQETRRIVFYLLSKSRGCSIMENIPRQCIYSIVVIAGPHM